jgi:4-hydroxy-4-methyl-2-oxoglutarate aldolase
VSLELRARLQALSASAVEDARGKQGALPASIQRLAGEGVVAGRAVTARCASGSVAAVLRALSQAGVGDVLVAHGPGECGYFGELTGAEAVRRGMAAIVVVGLVRDIEKLRTLPLPVFARGLTPHGGLPSGRGEVGVALRLGEVLVRPGDWIVGDADGLVVVPAGDVEGVTARAEEITATELDCWQNILGGASFFDQPGQDGTTLGERMLRGDS